MYFIKGNQKQLISTKLKKKRTLSGTDTSATSSKSDLRSKESQMKFLQSVTQQGRDILETINSIEQGKILILQIISFRHEDEDQDVWKRCSHNIRMY